mgnify:CR=1 FL=1
MIYRLGTYAQKRVSGVTTLIPDDNATWTNVASGMNTGVGFIEWTNSAVMQWSNTGSFASLPANKDGYLELQLNYSPSYSSSGYSIFGLSLTSGGTAYDTVEYSFYYEGPYNRISILVGGARQNATYNFVMGSTLKIERILGVIKFYMNGSLFYTHPTNTNAELFYNSRINRYMGSYNLKIVY